MEKFDYWIVSSPKIAGWAMSLELVQKKLLENYGIVWVKAPSTYFLTSLFSRTVNVDKIEKVLEKKFNSITRNFLLLKRRVPYFHAFFLAIKFTIRFFKSKDFDFEDQKREIPLGKIIASNTSRLSGNYSIGDYSIKLKHVFEIISEIYQTTIYLEKITKIYGMPKIIIFPNGRCMTGASVFAFARKNKIKSNGYECGFKAQSWQLFENSPHFPPDWWEKLRRYKIKKYQEKELIDYWLIKSKGLDVKNKINWSANFDSEKMPVGINKKSITFFTSSNHEKQPFDEWNYFEGDFFDQIEAARSLKDISRINGFKLIIRRHPNSVSINGIDTEEKYWKEFMNDSNVVYISPHSRIDSYALIRKSTLIFTHESTIGLEAIFLGKPSYATGPAYWAISEDLRAWSSKRIERLIQNPKIYKGKILFQWAEMMLKGGEDLQIFDFFKDNVAVFQHIPVYYKESKLRKILK